ncbi:single-stranded DNA-binding protein [Flavobacterium psychrotrophum]|uniref:single-stranded DNA-binding protein n=1 Tax=Flavobacterium psychrotrophum TaxID=2294119 RepID=UPI000E30CB3F|nr:single-stranded DNA-binding protein [Flavobacterium psychrotrophum]
MEITGRLTRDATVRAVGEKEVVNFSVAVNNTYRDKSGERKTDTEYFNCSYWISPKVAQFLTKGSVVQVSGWLKGRAYTTSDGQPKTSLDLRTDRIIFHGSGQPRGQQDTAGITVNEAEVITQGEEHDDLPF